MTFLIYKVSFFLIYQGKSLLLNYKNTPFCDIIESTTKNKKGVFLMHTIISQYLAFCLLIFTFFNPVGDLN